MSPNKNMYLPKKACSFRRPLQHIIQLYSQTTLALFVNMFLHLSLCLVGKLEELGRAVAFSDQLVDLPLVYVLPYFVITDPVCK